MIIGKGKKNNIKDDLRYILKGIMED